MNPILHALLEGCAIWIALNGLGFLLWVGYGEVSFRLHRRAVRRRVARMHGLIDLTNRPSDPRLPR